MKPYIFLDAGWTLVFPDYDRLSHVAAERGYTISREQWEQAMADFGWHYDKGQSKGVDRWGVAYFLTYVLRAVKVARRDIPGIARALQRQEEIKSLWSYAYPWVYQALDSLRARGCRMSVISNADGRVREGFEALGLAQYFEQIFDSHIVGYTKPNSALFQHAMEKQQAGPAECLYVGDLYYVDVLGANRAGMAAVHIDRFDRYAGLPGCHVHSVLALPELLDQDPDWSEERFFPLRDWQPEAS